jgi:hypothetical protein
MKRVKLDAESLVVMTFVTSTPPQAVAFAISAEITDCSCRPYFCINWPSGDV